VSSLCATIIPDSSTFLSSYQARAFLNECASELGIDPKIFSFSKDPASMLHPAGTYRFQLWNSEAVKILRSKSFPEISMEEKRGGSIRLSAGMMLIFWKERPDWQISSAFFEALDKCESRPISTEC
jgi:hypothetical protein